MLSALIFSLFLPAQESPNAAIIWRVDGAASFEQFGWTIHQDVYDLNGDGVGDIIAKNHAASTNFLYKNGSVQAFSGADGSLLWRRDGSADGESYGKSFNSADDLNGDGVMDFFHRQPEADLNGKVDNGMVETISGATGLLIWNRYGWSNGEALGSSATVLPDLTWDGVAEIAIGCSGADEFGMIDNGYIEVTNGAWGMPLWHMPGMSPLEGMGAEVALVGDLDGDGQPDLVTSNPSAGTNGLWNNGFVQAMSSAYGFVLWRVDGAKDYSSLGQSISDAGDVNGDGVSDILVVDPDAFVGYWYYNGSITMFSGANGSVLWTASGMYHGDRLGSNVSTNKDVNGDGVLDVLAGSPDRSSLGKTANGALNAYDGATGSLLWRKDGTDNYGELGRNFWVVGDLNGDGLSDAVAAMSEADASGNIATGVIQAFSGLNGSTLWRVEGSSDNEHLGLIVVRPGDLSGDGVDDLVSGSEFADTNGLSNNGFILALNGVDGSVLWALDGEVSDTRLGGNLKDFSDLDGDGFKDIVSHSNRADSSSLSNNGSARAMSGVNGGELWRLDGDGQDDRFGWAVREIPDLDFDGNPDILVSAPWADTNGLSDNGYMVALSGGTTVPLTCSDDAGLNGIKAGVTNTWNVGGMESGTKVWVAASLVGSGILDRGIGFKLLLDPSAFVFGYSVADVNGMATFVTPVTSKAVGKQVHAQAVGKNSQGQWRASRLISHVIR